MHWIAPVLWKKKMCLALHTVCHLKGQFLGWDWTDYINYFPEEETDWEELGWGRLWWLRKKVHSGWPSGGWEGALQRWNKQVRVKGGQAPCFCLCWASRPLVLAHLHARLSGLSPAGWLLLLTPGSHPLVIAVWGRLCSVCPLALALLLLDHSI